MLGSRVVRTSAFGALMLLLVSCSSLDAPTGANQPTAGLVEQVAYSKDEARRAAHERLKDRLKQVRDSLKAERELHREEYRAAKAAWKLYKEAVKATRKAGGITELLRCEPVEFSAEAELIGPDGGSIKVGAHELVVPRGALDQEVIITAVAPVSELVEVDLYPHGLQFSRPAQLALSYSHCLQPPGWMNLVIVYLGLENEVLEVAKSVNKKGLKEVVADLNHFSRYAVAW